MKCDYELTYYLNGNPGKLRVPALDVDENTTDEDLKAQLRDVFTLALNNKNHILHDSINNLVRSGFIFQPVKIKNLSIDQLASPEGIVSEVNKTENDGNTKFSEIGTHLQTATHDYKDIMSILLTSLKEEVPAIHLTAERVRDGEKLSPSDSAFGVYILGSKGVDSITLHTPLNNVDQFNANDNLAKLAAKQMFVYAVNRKYEDWYNKDTKGFKEFVKQVANKFETYSKKENKTGLYMSYEDNVRNKFSPISDPLNYMKEVFTSLMMKQEMTWAVDSVGGRLDEFILKEALEMTGLDKADPRIVDEVISFVEETHLYSSIDLDYAKYQLAEQDKIRRDNLSLDEDLPFSKDFESTDPNDYKKSERSSKELLKGLSNNLQNMYGIKFNVWTAEEIANQFDISPNATLLYSEQRAFVKDGQVYLNSDKASLAEPIHELGHIVLQGLKSMDNSLYNAIISKFSAHPNYQQIAKHYSNLSPDAMAEEVFVTTLGEMFNGRAANKVNQKWETKNKGFFNRIFDSIKNFLSELLGIDSKRFYDLTPYELMNLSFEDIHSNFGNTLLKGQFTPMTEITRISNELTEQGVFLKGPDGEFSSLYANLDELGFSDDVSTSLWLKTRTPNFLKWSNDQVIKDERGEPALFVRTKENNKYTLATIDSDHSNLVYLKGAIENDGVYQVLSPSQARSIHNAGYSTKINTPVVDFIQKYAMQNGFKLSGTKSSMDIARAKLANEYQSYEFLVKQSITGEHFIDYYKALDDKIKALREFLMINKNIDTIC